MRKTNLFSAVLSLFLLVPASITWAQVTKTLNGTVRYESGMSETKFSTPNGDVVMKLPQSMSGAMITGTVSTEPAGKMEKEKNRNLKELLKFVVMLDGQKIPLAATPQTFDWLTHQDRQLRTPIELLNVSGVKIAELSLPPVLSAPATVNSGNSPRLTTSSNIVVKGDALNVYTDQQFSPGEKFILTDSKGQHFTMNPVCLSSQQAVMNVPDGTSPGNCTVSRQVMNQPASNAAVAHFTLMSMDISSPTTNLRPGQQSFVQVLCKGSAGNGFVPITGLEEPNIYYIDPKITDKDSSEAMQIPIQICIDLRNLNPNIVTMEGGNLQRVYPADNRYTIVNLRNDGLPTNFQIRKNITGNATGSFSVSATLHEDYNTSTDPFRPQINVLKTPEDFNAWANALKKDLKEYAGVQNNDAAGQVIKTNAQKAIENMPVCTSSEQLDECKAVAYTLAQPLHVPKGAAISWLSSYEACKVAAKAIDNNLAGNTELIDYDVLKNGSEFIKRIGESLKDAALQTESINVQQLIDRIQTGAETKENLQDLKNRTNVLTAKTDIKIQADDHITLKTGMKDLIMSSLQLPSNALRVEFIYIMT